MELFDIFYRNNQKNLMKKYFLILLLYFSGIGVLNAQTGADICSEGKIKSGERLIKTSRVLYPGDGNIDVTYYKLQLLLDYPTKFLVGLVTVKAKSTKNQLKSFYLDLANTMLATSVIKGNKNLPYLQSNDSLKITLDREYAVGEEFSIDITYSGYPKSGNFGNFVFSTHTSQISNPVIWSLSEPYGAKEWWPSKDTPADKADSSEVWISADPYFVSVSNGVLTETVDNPEGTLRTYKWKNSYPISNYLISIAMTNYHRYDTPFEYEPGKILPVTHYIYPEQFNSVKSNLDKVNDMISIFSDKFGQYPFIKEKYGQAQVQNGASMEHQTISTMSTFNENVEAHELAHQWYGDKVTCKNWQNIWLNEGFASYSECIYRENKYGAADFKSYVNGFMSQAKNAVGTIYVQNILSVNEIFSPSRSYKKGAMVLHMLRGIVGNDKFFQIMREYADEPGLAYNTATTEDFQKVAERVYGQTLEYFFKQWIYGDTYPKYTVGTNFKLVSGNNYNVTVRLIQNTNPSLNPRFFKMPVPIRITTANGIVNTTLFNELQDQGWVIPVVGQPSKVEIDPDDWILKDIVATTSIKENEDVPKSFYLSQNYPNPFNPETVISYQLPEAGHVSLKVYDVLGREITSLVNQFQREGTYSSRFNIHNLPSGERGFQFSSGIYYYTLETGNYTQTRKMILLK
ncbi:MAG: peptidase M1 [Ignavibacteriae bacterium HGW-Ignavibacteriae-3]|nr:MAG: peptidase M1 [Ignavibacteriae bacterium HGW-Ignavibacteriae-3]